MNIIKYKFVFLFLSTALVIASIASVILFGLKPGIDFVGGVSWQLKFSSPVERDALAKVLPVSALITSQEEGRVLVRLPELSDADRQTKLKDLTKQFGEVSELQFQNIGPAVGEDLKRSAFWAIGLVLLAISLYIAFSFRKVSKPVSSWKYGLITLITLFHDAVIPAGMFAVLGKYMNWEVDVNFVVAVLVVVGFSVHDKIVVFDRIRENLRLFGSSTENFNATVNSSINQTLVRSINTTITLILTLIALYFFGPANMSYFILTILVGVTVGTYSSIFVASPLLTLLK